MAVGKSVDGLAMVLLGGIQTLAGLVVARSSSPGCRTPWPATRLLARCWAPSSGVGAGVPARHCRWRAATADFDNRAQRRGKSAGRRHEPQCCRSPAAGQPFGGVKAVDGISLIWCAGELLALIGPNGAGKSTTFNMVAASSRPMHGDVLLGTAGHHGPAPRDHLAHGRGPHLPDR